MQYVIFLNVLNKVLVDGLKDIQTGFVSNKPWKQGSYKVRKKYVKYIIDLIKQKQNIMLWQILAKFNDKLKDITISKSHLDNIIRYANLTYKKIIHI